MKNEHKKNISKAIEEAKELGRRYTSSTMKPCVFRAITNGQIHVGVNYQPNQANPGERFHFDHGFGVGRNSDAKIVWAG